MVTRLAGFLIAVSGYDENKRAAFSNFAFYPDLSIVERNNVLGYSQARTGAFLLFRCDAFKLIEYLFALIFRDARAVVYDFTAELVFGSHQVIVWEIR
jgi:hypothetical protein